MNTKDKDNSRAAIPSYIEKVVSKNIRELNISAEIYFNQLLPIWDQNFYKNQSSTYSTKTIPNDSKMAQGFRERQTHLAFLQQPNTLILDAKSIAPFCTGLGNEHPIENGFSFLNPYGVPYLAGSGVKGIARRAAKELQENTITKTAINEEIIEALFGRDADDSTNSTDDTNGINNTRGALSFWDVIPKVSALTFDVMTPHTGSYYRNKETYPKESDPPIPIYFLTIPHKSEFTFYISCAQQRLQKIEALKNDGWKEIIQEIFAHAFQWIGFGSKKSVGYGHLQLDGKELQRRQNEITEKIHQEEENRKRAEELKNLPEDAAEWQKNHPQHDKDQFLRDVEEKLNQVNSVSRELYDILVNTFNRQWPGLMDNPDQTKGKRQKPRFTGKKKELAKKLLTLKPEE